MLEHIWYIRNKILFKGQLDGKQCIRKIRSRIEELKILLQKNEHTRNNSPTDQEFITPIPSNWQPLPHNALKYKFDTAWKHRTTTIGFVVSDHSDAIIKDCWQELFTHSVDVAESLVHSHQRKKKAIYVERDAKILIKALMEDNWRISQKMLGRLTRVYKVSSRGFMLIVQWIP